MTIKYMKKHFAKFRDLNGRMKRRQPISPSSTLTYNIPFTQPSPISPPPSCLPMLVDSAYWYICQQGIEENQGLAIKER